MVAISFSGITKRGPFYVLILNGEKKQTIREPRKIPIKIGKDLDLYWKQRVAKDRKPIHFIGRSKVLEVKRIRLSDVWDDEKNAFADGFINLSEFRDWFYPPWRFHMRLSREGIYEWSSSIKQVLDEKYDIIKWGELTEKGEMRK